MRRARSCCRASFNTSKVRFRGAKAYLSAAQKIDLSIPQRCDSEQLGGDRACPNCWLSIPQRCDSEAWERQTGTRISAAFNTSKVRFRELPPPRHHRPRSHLSIPQRCDSETARRWSTGRWSTLSIPQRCDSEERQWADVETIRRLSIPQRCDSEIYVRGQALKNRVLSIPQRCDSEAPSSRRFGRYRMSPFNTSKVRFRAGLSSLLLDRLALFQYLKGAIQSRSGERR